MAKAEKPKTKSKEKPDKDQAERFKETAQQLGADETGSTFENVFKKVVLPRSKSKTQSS